MLNALRSLYSYIVGLFNVRPTEETLAWDYDVYQAWVKYAADDDRIVSMTEEQYMAAKYAYYHGVLIGTRI